MTDSPLEPDVQGVEDLDSADEQERLDRTPEGQPNRETPVTLEPDQDVQDGRPVEPPD